MKKIIKIYLLVVVFLASALIADAKTTTKASGAFSLTCLMHKQTQYGSTGFMFNSDSKIEAALKKAGFSLKSKKVTKEEIEDGTEGDTAPGKTIDYVYTKKGITVKWSSYAYDEAPNEYFKNRITINFSDKAAKNAFMKTVTSNGYKNEGYNSYHDAGDWVYIDVKGNEVILEGNWG